MAISEHLAMWLRFLSSLIYKVAYNNPSLFLVVFATTRPQRLYKKIKFNEYYNIDDP